MQFSVAFTLALASVATAAPGLLQGLGDTKNQPTGNINHIDGSTDNTCGKDLEMNCCNEVDESGDSTEVAQGILSGLDLANGALAGLFKGCSKLTVPVGTLTLPPSPPPLLRGLLAEPILTSDMQAFSAPASATS